MHRVYFQRQTVSGWNRKWDDRNNSGKRMADVLQCRISLTPHIEETEAKVGRYIAANQYDSVAIAGEAMEKLVQQKIDEIIPRSLCFFG